MSTIVSVDRPYPAETTSAASRASEAASQLTSTTRGAPVSATRSAATAPRPWRAGSATTTDAGLKVRCEIDVNAYPAGVKVTDVEMDAIDIRRHDFHGDWNYTISPKPPPRSDNS